MAFHGWDIHYWPFPHINIHQAQYKSTLTVTAIRTASVVTSENIDTDERLQKFRCQMNPHKYYASAIVPFRRRGRIIGILSLGCPEKGVFQDQAEVCLLEEMSVDISFALDTIENEKERRQAEKALQGSENRYRDLLETSNDAILINSQGRISFAHNMAAGRSCLRTSIKKVLNAVVAGKKDEAVEALKAAQPVLDTMVSKGIIHRNKAARHKRELNARVKALAAG